MSRTRVTPSLARSRRARPRLESLECRLAPAFDLTIAALDATANVVVTQGIGLTTFSANATGATVLIDDVLAELQAGNDVIVNTGSAGPRAGRSPGNPTPSSTSTASRAAWRWRSRPRGRSTSRGPSPTRSSPPPSI